MTIGETAWVTFPRPSKRASSLSSQIAELDPPAQLSGIGEGREQPLGRCGNIYFANHRVRKPGDARTTHISFASNVIQTLLVWDP